MFATGLQTVLPTFAGRNRKNKVDYGEERNATDAMACTACHHHHHSAHHGGMSVWVAPAVSLLLLAVGMVAAHTGAEWFTDGYVRKIWFAVAFLPSVCPLPARHGKPCAQAITSTSLR